MFDISLRGTKPDDDRVIILEDGGGWLSMKDIPGFTTEMDKVSRRQRPSCINDVTTIDSYHSIDWSSVCDPPKKRKNIGYVEFDSDEDTQPPIKQQKTARSTASESEEDTKLPDDAADESTKDSHADDESEVPSDEEDASS